MVSVTDVNVSRDLAHAKVYMTVLGKEDEKDAAEAIEVLNKAAGFLRTKLARNNNARTTPKLRFFFDGSVGRGQHLSGLIERAVEADKKAAGNDSQENDSRQESE